MEMVVSPLVDFI